jgi:hypothetical protein
MPKKKLLDQKLVNEFAEFRALKNKIDKWLDVVRDEFLKQFDAGAECPIDGPFLLVIETSHRADVNWKELLFARIAADLEREGTAADAAEELAAIKIAGIEKNAPQKEIRRLMPKTNPSWAGKIMKAIVRKLDSRTARGF